MRFPRHAAIGAVLAALALSAPAAAQQFDSSGSSDGLFGIFDEVRLGGSFTVQDTSPEELMISGQLFFTTFVPPFENYFLNTFLRPRPHIWTTIATDEGTNQLSGGLTWNFPIYRPASSSRRVLAAPGTTGRSTARPAATISAAT